MSKKDLIKKVYVEYYGNRLTNEKKKIYYIFISEMPNRGALVETVDYGGIKKPTVTIKPYGQLTGSSIFDFSSRVHGSRQRVDEFVTWLKSLNKEKLDNLLKEYK